MLFLNPVVLPWFRQTCSQASFTNNGLHEFWIIPIEERMGKPANEELQRESSLYEDLPTRLKIKNTTKCQPYWWFSPFICLQVALGGIHVLLLVRVPRLHPIGIDGDGYDAMLCRSVLVIIEVPGFSMGLDQVLGCDILLANNSWNICCSDT